MKEKVIAFFSLFGSTATLLCCALPAALAGIAGGAAVASLISTFPWLITVSRYSGWIFLVAGLLILFTGVISYRPKGSIACSITGGKGCSTASSFQKWMFGIAVAFYGIGAFVAYGLVPVLRFFEI
jgi:mercuric ion transport protein